MFTINLRRYGWLILLLALAVIFVGEVLAKIPREKTAFQSQARVIFSIKDLPRYAPDKVNVTLRPGYSLDALQDINAQVGVTEVRYVSLSEELENKLGGKRYTLRVLQTTDIPALVTQYKALPAVLEATPSYLFYGTVIPNDEYFDVWQSNLYQANDKDIDADLAWDITTGSSSVRIGIIDTGVDPDHPDLMNNLLPGYDFTDVFFYQDANWRTVGDYSTSDSDPHDEYGHGTHVTGIASARGNNSIGIAGVNWYSEAVPIRAGYTMAHYPDSPNEHHHAVFDEDNLIQAIDYARTQNCDVINMSLGGYVDNPALHSALILAYQDSIVLVAAAGNDDITDTFYPAGYPEVIAVGAADITDHKSWFSNYGSWIDFAAPGGTSDPGNYTSEDITSTMPMYTDFYMNTDDPVWDWSEYWPLKGTSMAAPHVSGLGALILSVNPELGPAQIKQIIEDTAEQVGGYYYDPSTGKSQELGHGRINAYDAVVEALPPLSVSVSGPSYLVYKQFGTYTANVSGGSGYFSYQWYRRDDGSSTWETLGTEQTQRTRMETTGFTMRVDVHDNVTQEDVTDTKYVEYGGRGGPEPKVLAGLPTEYALFQNVPNPFNPETKIEYGLPEAVQVRLVIYNLMGQEVRVLVDTFQPAGFHKVVWDGRDNQGRLVGSGLYLYRLTAGDFAQTRRMILLK